MICAHWFCADCGGLTDIYPFTKIEMGAPLRTVTAALCMECCFDLLVGLSIEDRSRRWTAICSAGTTHPLMYVVIHRSIRSTISTEGDVMKISNERSVSSSIKNVQDLIHIEEQNLVKRIAERDAAQAEVTELENRRNGRTAAGRAVGTLFLGSENESRRFNELLDVLMQKKRNVDVCTHYLRSLREQKDELSNPSKSLA